MKKLAASLSALSIALTVEMAGSATPDQAGHDRARDSLREAPEPSAFVALASHPESLGRNDPHLVAESFRVRPQNTGLQTADGGFDGTIVERTLGDGPAHTTEVPLGASVRLVLHAPEGTEFHVHGYDLTGTAGPEAAVVLSFRANLTGRFPVEAHGVEDALGRSERVLVYIEVRPE